MFTDLQNKILQSTGRISVGGALSGKYYTQLLGISLTIAQGESTLVIGIDKKRAESMVIRLKKDFDCEAEIEPNTKKGALNGYIFKPIKSIKDEQLHT